MKTFNSLVFATAFFLSAAQTAFAASQPSSTITFMHLNDVHAYLAPHKDLVPAPENGKNATKIVEKGGLARTATLIKKIRKDNPNSLLMNIGDTFHGGVEAMFTQGNALVDPMNALGVDVGVPGNWDFAYGPAVFRSRFFPEDQLMPFMRDSNDGEPTMRERMAERFKNSNMPMMRKMAGMIPTNIKKPNYPNLAANVTLVRNGETALPATLIKVVDGVKVGFIGITSDIVPRMHKMMAMGMNFLEGEDEYRKLINQHTKELRKQGAHIVVVMSELGIQKDYRLAQIVEPGVDVFFSAHTHEASYTPHTSKSGALVVEAGNDGFLGRMDLTVKNGKVVDHNWELLPIDSGITEDAEVAKIVAKERAPFLADNINMTSESPFWLQVLDQPIDSVVGHTDVMLTRYASLESSFNNAFTDMSRKVTDTDIAITPGFRFGANIAEKGYMYEDRTVATGNITLEDVYRYFPAPFTISTGKVSVKRLQEIIESLLTEVYSPDAFLQSGGWINGFSGIDVKVDLTKPDGHRVISIADSETGKVYKPSDLLTVTGCTRPMEGDDVLCSFSGFENITGLQNPDTGENWTVIDFFVHGLAKDYLPDGQRDDIIDVSNTPVWPAVPYIQPVAGIGETSDDFVTEDHEANSTTVDNSEASTQSTTEKTEQPATDETSPRRPFFERFRRN